MGYDIGMLDVYQEYLVGGGEMGERTRSFDWQTTSLGSPEQWPTNLLTIVGTILNSRFPMFLWWGNELIQFYNDAYRPSLGADGKHPLALGQNGEDCWPEIWPVIKPLIDSIMAGGQATWSEDQLIPIYRNNRLEDVYWTFSYSKVSEGGSKPGGVLVTCFETTEKVLSDQRTTQTLRELGESEARLRYMVEDAPVAIGVLSGRGLIIETANKKMLEIWGRNEHIIGQALHLALPELEGQPFLQILDDVFTSGQPFFGNELKALLQHEQDLKEVFLNFVYHPLKNAKGQSTAIMAVAVDISEQVLARKALEKAQDILSLAITSAGIGTWSADIATDQLTYSAQTQFIHGVPEGISLSLESSAAMIQPEFRERVLTNIRRAVETKTSFNEEYWIDPMDGGKSRWLRSNGKAYYDDQGNPLYITGTILDLTEQMKDDLRKNDFIGMVSHELKTPLTSLTALVQMLHLKAIKSDDTFSAGALERANKQVKKMTAMINGFLNISRLESSKIQISKKTFDLAALLAEVIGELKLTVSTHTLHFADCGPVEVAADYDKIVSVFTNLLTNAIKYSPGAKNVLVNCQADQQQVQVSVRDEGMGITPKDRERLFERYYRVESLESKNIAGFGLGLYLSAEIIQRHDGKVWVESEPGIGSTFFFTLPLNPDYADGRA